MNCEQLTTETRAATVIYLICAVLVGNKELAWLVPSKSKQMHVININPADASTNGTCNTFWKALLYDRVISNKSKMEEVFAPERWRKYSNDGNKDHVVYVYLLDHTQHVRIIQRGVYEFAADANTPLVLVQSTLDKVKSAEWWKIALAVTGVAVLLGALGLVYKRNKPSSGSSYDEI